MTLEIAYNGVAFPGDIRPSSVEPTSFANDGESAFGGFDVEDPDSLYVLVGHRPVTMEESSCAQPRIFTGWTTERIMGRSRDTAMVVDVARQHDVTVVDLNALFGFRMLTGSGANRPEESWGDRLAWILSTDALTGLIADTGHVMAAPPAWECDAADYRGQFPSAVFADLLDVSNTYKLNFFAFWDPVAEEVGLFLGAQDSSIGVSTLSISNDIADVDGETCFFPSDDTILARKPDQVFSEVTVTYRSGTKRLFRRRPSTEATYIRRAAQYDVPRVYSDNAASTVADAFLTRHSYEVDQVTTTIRVPASAAGLVQAGQRMNVKFTHLPGYTSETSMRVAECTPRPVDDLADEYDIRLVLELPQQGTPEGGGTEECPWTESGMYPPMNSATSDADGNVIYWRPGLVVPREPTPFYAGDWRFPAYGSGGSPDYAGDCSENRVRCIVAGLGTMEIATATYLGTPRDLVATLHHVEPGGPVTDETQYGTTGDTFTFEIPDDDYCYHYVDVTDDDECGSKWGFAGMTWTAQGDDEEDEGFPPGTTLGETPDVNLGTPTDGQALVYDADTATWVAGTPAMDLDDLADVDAPSPNDGDVLTFDSGTGEWVPEAPTGGDVATDAIWDAAGDLAVGTGADTAARLAIGDEGQVLAVVAGAVAWADLPSGLTPPPIVVVVDGGGAAIASGAAICLPLTSAGEFTAWTIVADQSGSIEFDLQVDGYADYPPDAGDSIVAAAPPVLDGEQKATDSTLAGWTTGFSAGDVLRVVVASAATVEHVTLTLERS